MQPTSSPRNSSVSVSSASRRRRNSTRSAPSARAAASCSRSRVWASWAVSTPGSWLPLSPEVARTKATCTPRSASITTVPAQKNSMSSGWATMQSARLMRRSSGPLKSFLGKGLEPFRERRDLRRRHSSLSASAEDRTGDRVELDRLPCRAVLLHRGPEAGGKARDGLDHRFRRDLDAQRLGHRGSLADAREQPLLQRRLRGDAANWELLGGGQKRQRCKQQQLLPEHDILVFRLGAFEAAAIEGQADRPGEVAGDLDPRERAGLQDLAGCRPLRLAAEGPRRHVAVHLPQPSYVVDPVQEGDHRAAHQLGRRQLQSRVQLGGLYRDPEQVDGVGLKSRDHLHGGAPASQSGALDLDRPRVIAISCDDADGRARAGQSRRDEASDTARPEHSVLQPRASSSSSRARASALPVTPPLISLASSAARSPSPSSSRTATRVRPSAPRRFSTTRWWSPKQAIWARWVTTKRSEEHTSELQSQSNLVCRLLLEKKKHSQALPRAVRPARRAAIVPSA